MYAGNFLLPVTGYISEAVSQNELSNVRQMLALALVNVMRYCNGIVHQSKRVDDQFILFSLHDTTAVRPRFRLDELYGA